ncbi:hypothetical protein GGH96_002256 [Coemansia sp. RSA 1972]|nr:hypothetical protein GGH96_002256 [Coemansia sp. RSA 1972]
MFDKVKTVHITIQANYYSVTSLHLICGEMIKYLKQWPNVIELNLCIGFNYFSGLMADRNINRYQTSLQPYVKTISKLLPRVSKLVLHGAVQCEVLDEWFGDLAIHYSNQLWYLDRDYSIVIDTPPLQTFNMLTSLSITFGEFANYSTACAAASQLQQLGIYNISCIIDESLPAVKTVLAFPELRYLLLEYPRAANVFANKNAHTSLPKLKLPCLETLHVLFGGNYCPVLACAVLPRSMKSINIIGQYGILSVLDKCGVQRVEKLTVTALLNPTNNTSATKNLFKNLYDCKRVTRYGCLRLDKTLTLDPEDLETLAITHLQIGMEMDSTMVIAFITKLTKLVDIKFTNVSTEDSTLILADPEINGDVFKTVVPFTAPINSISVNYNNDRDPTQPSSDLIKYMLLRLPTLRYLTANKVSAEDITKHAIEDYPIFAGRLRQVQPGKLEVVVDSNSLNIPKLTEIQSSIDYAEYEATYFNPALLPDGAIKGVVLAVTIAHVLVDGYGFNMFMRRWAEISKKLVADNMATDFGASDAVYNRSVAHKAVSSPQKPVFSALQKMYIPGGYLSRLVTWVSPGIRGKILEYIHVSADISISCFHVSRKTLDQLRQSVKDISATDQRISDNDILMAALTIAYAQSVFKLESERTNSGLIVVDSDDLNIPEFTEIQSSLDFEKFEAANFNPALLPDGAVKPTAFFTGGFQEGKIALANICMVQFKKGKGVVLVVRIAHVLVDGYGFNMFMHRWADINIKLIADSTATDFGVSRVVHNRSFAQKVVPTPQEPPLSMLQKMYIPGGHLSRFATRLSPGIRGKILEFIQKFADISISCFHVSRKTLDQLRQSVKEMSSTGLRISENDILMAALTIAYAQSALTHESASSKKPRNFVTMEAADIRHRIPNSNLENYAGNSALNMMVYNPVELLQKSISPDILAQVALGVRKSTNEITSEYIAQVIHGAESESDVVFRQLLYTARVAEKLMVTNLSRFTFYTTDFGWGAPQFVAPVNGKFPKFASFFPAHPSKGGVYVHLNDFASILQKMRMNCFWAEISEFVY